jgi:hypothetical protein
VGLSTVNVDAFELMSDGSILLSLNATLSINPLVSVTNADIIRFTPTSLGDTTAGTFSWYFDGSDVGLTQSAKISTPFLLPPMAAVHRTSATGSHGVSAVDEISPPSRHQPGPPPRHLAVYFDGSMWG